METIGYAHSVHSQSTASLPQHNSQWTTNNNTTAAQPQPFGAALISPPLIYQSSGFGSGTEFGISGAAVDTNKYYEILGVDKSATENDIKKAYRTAAVQCSPDEPRNVDRFIALTGAYQVLTNSYKRALYDRIGEAGVLQSGGGVMFGDCGDHKNSTNNKRSRSGDEQQPACATANIVPPHIHSTTFTELDTDSEAESSLHLAAFLQACKCDSAVIAMIPQVLLANVLVKGKTEARSAYGRTGPALSDQIIFIDTRTKTNSEHKYVLIKITNAALINPTSIPQLRDTSSSTDIIEEGDPPTSIYAYILLQSNNGLSLPRKRVNLDIEAAFDARSFDTLSWTFQFPDIMTDTLQPCNALLTYRQYAQATFIPFICENNRTMETISLQYKQQRHRHQLHDALQWISSIAPLAVFDVVLSLLHNNDIIFGLRRLCRSHYQSAHLLRNAWWKMRMSNQWGKHSVRWSDEVLRRWLQEYSLTADLWQTHSMRWKVWPVHYAAAVHLQCRINTFRLKYMRLSLEQTWTTAEQQTRSDLHTNGRRGTYRRCHEVPSAIRQFLLAAPPFHRHPSYFSSTHSLAAAADEVSSYNDIAWFVTDGFSMNIGLYCGPVYAYDDNDYVHQLGHVAAVTNNAVDTRTVREFYHIDDDCLPVVAIQYETSTIYQLANSVAEWFAEEHIDKTINDLMTNYDKSAVTLLSSTHQMGNASHMISGDNHHIISDNYTIKQSRQSDTLMFQQNIFSNPNQNKQNIIQTKNTEQRRTDMFIYPPIINYCKDRMTERFNHIQELYFPNTEDDE